MNQNWTLQAEKPEIPKCPKQNNQCVFCCLIDTQIDGKAKTKSTKIYCKTEKSNQTTKWNELITLDYWLWMSVTFNVQLTLRQVYIHKLVSLSNAIQIHSQRERASEREWENWRMRVNCCKSRSRSFNLSRFCWVVFWLTESEWNRKSETDRLTVLFELRTALETQYVSLCMCVCATKWVPVQVATISISLHFLSIFF